MKKLFVLFSLMFPLCVYAQKEYKVTDLGVQPGACVVQTEALQCAIDQVAREGGIITFTPGTYLTGTLWLRSGVTLNLQKDATLLGSTNPYDYDRTDPQQGPRGDEDVNLGLLQAEDAENFGIIGEGTIDGQGLQLALNIDSLHHIGERLDPNYNLRRMRPTTRPKLFNFRNCRQIRISGITARNSAGWGLSFHTSSQLEISDVTIYNRAYWNNDGIDLNDCTDALITRCNINAADDGICLKSDVPDLCCQRISISKCRIASSSNAVKLGTSSAGGFRDISIRDILVYDTFRSAVALETVDGGVLDGVLVDGVKAVNTGNPFFVCLGARKGERKGICRNIRIRNVEAEVPFGRPDEAYDLRGPEVNYFHNPWPVSIAGLPGQYIENVILENLRIIFPGRATRGMAYIGLYRAHEVSEAEKAYPEYTMYGELPSWAFYFRHVNGLRLQNVSLQLKDSDFRPAILLEDALNVDFEQILFPQDKPREEQIYWVK